MKNPTFSRFTHCKSVFSFALNNFISAFFACIFFIHTRFPDTHPAIIDRETFALVQDLRQHRRRPDRTGIVSMFSGLLYCADCGEKLYYSSTNNYKREGAFFFCSSYRKNSSVCSAHYIRERTVEQLVLEGLQRLLWYIQVYEKRFAQEQMERFCQRHLKMSIFAGMECRF